MAIFIFTYLTAVKNIKIKLQKLELHKLLAPTILVETDLLSTPRRNFRAIAKGTPQPPRRSADVANYVCSLAPRSAGTETLIFCPGLEK